MTLNFQPEPARVSPEVLAALARPQPASLPGLLQSIETRVREILYPETSSMLLFPATQDGLIETALNSFASGRCLCCVNGIHANQWLQSARALGIEADLLDASYGKPFDAAEFEKELSVSSYDLIILTEIEPFSGILNDIRVFSEIIRRKNPDALILVDCSASVASVPSLDLRQNADVIAINTDQSFGLPPGLVCLLLGERAHFKSIGNAGTGWAMNYARLHAWANPASRQSDLPFPYLRAFDRQLDSIFLEGLENRFQRIQNLGTELRKWTKTSLFQLVQEPQNASPTTTLLKPPSQFSVQNVLDFLEPYGVRVGTVPNEIHSETIVITHMNHTQMDEIEMLMQLLERFESDYNTRPSVPAAGLSLN